MEFLKNIFTLLVVIAVGIGCMVGASWLATETGYGAAHAVVIHKLGSKIFAAMLAVGVCLAVDRFVFPHANEKQAITGKGLYSDLDSRIRAAVVVGINIFRGGIVLAFAWG